MNMIYAILLLLCAQNFQTTDLKVTMKSTTGGGSVESTIYIKGARQRTEAAGTATVYQCDLKRTLHINDRARKYFVAGLEDAGGAPDVEIQPARPVRRGVVVTQTVTLTDTGERKQMFGRTARHILSKTVIDSPPGTCDPGRTEMESDGWYIDLSSALSCSTERTAAPPRPAPGGCRDEVRLVEKGSAKLGFPVLLTTRMKLVPEGEPENPEEVAMLGRMMTTTMEVTEISSARLDQALFEVPVGYTAVASMSELYGYTGDAQPVGVPVGDRTQPTPSVGEEERVKPPTTPTKQPGTIRIGVAAINNSSGRGLSAALLRQTLIAEIGNAKVEAVPLSADTDSEARRLACDFILYTDLTALKQSAASKAGGIFGRVTGVGNPVAEKFEARVEFRLIPPGGGPPLLQSDVTAKEGSAEESVTAALVKEARAVTTATRKRN